jgi:hypothetical protein
MAHMENLYRPQAQVILLFKRCYALEKIDGTGALVEWNGEKLIFRSGGAGHVEFLSLFNIPDLTTKFTNIFGATPVAIFGEAYGGKMQGMSGTYGKSLKFIGYDVQINGRTFLDVPNAEDVIVNKLGLEFVHYTEISTDLAEIDAARNAFSVQAVRNGCGPNRKQEGVILRPLQEMTRSNGERIICKHKNDDFRETKTPRKVVDTADQVKLDNAEAIANEFVVAERLKHVLQSHPECQGLKETGIVIRAMLEDIVREGKGEFQYSKEVEKAIGKATVALYKQYLSDCIPK